MTDNSNKNEQPTPDIYLAIRKAIILENNEKVKFLFNQSKIDINKNIHNGYTLLDTAILKENEEIVNLFISQSDIDINKVSGDGYTPLCRAIETGNCEIVKILLLKSGICLDKESKGLTPLFMAIAMRHCEMVALLLSSNLEIDINKQSCNGLSPLGASIVFGNYKTTELLIKSNLGVDVNKESRKGFTPLVLAIIHNKPETFELLIGCKTIDINKESCYSHSTLEQGTPLYAAIVCGNLKIVKLLLSQENVKKIDDDKLQELVNITDKDIMAKSALKFYLDNQDLVENQNNLNENSLVLKNTISEVDNIDILQKKNSKHSDILEITGN